MIMIATWVASGRYPGSPNQVAAAATSMATSNQPKRWVRSAERISRSVSADGSCILEQSSGPGEQEGEHGDIDDEAAEFRQEIAAERVDETEQQPRHQRAAQAAEPA